jgi:hypothetical protein
MQKIQSIRQYVSGTSFDQPVSPLWAVVIAAEVGRLWVIICALMLAPYREFVPLLMTPVLTLLSV